MMLTQLLMMMHKIVFVHQNQLVPSHHRIQHYQAIIPTALLPRNVPAIPTMKVQNPQPQQFSMINFSIRQS